MVDAMRKSTLNKINYFLNIAKQHSTTPLSYLDAVDYLKQCDAAMNRCTELHYKAIILCTDDAAITTQDSAQSPVEAAAHELRVLLQGIIIATQPSTTTAATSGPVSIKLPNLELPIFDGSYSDWTSFKDLFLATIDKHPGLSQAQKLQYLKGKLAEEPASLIKSLKLTDGNYKEAWKLLDARYSNQREIVFSWLDKLIHHPKSLQSESASGLQSLLDNTNECLRALEVLTIDIKSWDCIIISVLLRKVDSNTRCEWAIRQSGAVIPTLVEFSTFLTNHIRGLIAKGAVSNSNSTARKTDKHVKSHFTTANVKCLICKGSHLIYKCEDLLDKSPKDRSTLIKQHHLCFNCLSGKHRMSDCSSKSRCRRCGKAHHTLLHEDRTPAGSQADRDGLPPQQQQNQSGSVSVQTNLSLSDSHVLLSTAKILIEDKYGVKQICRAIIDNCSQASFVSENCVRRLGIQRVMSSITVSGVGATAAGSTQGMIRVGLHSNYQRTPSPEMDLHILRKVTCELPKFKCHKRNYPHLTGLTLADPEYHIPQRVDIMIGADYYGSIMLKGVQHALNEDAPFAQESIFGWLLSGRVPLASHPTPVQIHHLTTEMDFLRKFWEVEEPPRSRILTKEEKECESHFQSTYKRDKDGRFTVAIPFNNKRAELGSSKSTALRRFLQVEKRLLRQPQFQQQYVDFMREYESLGHMERVPEGEQEEKVGSTFYLPHHFVVNESSSTTKLRVVFDGSVKSTTGVSLNDAMLVGATLQDELYFLLLRFRFHAIVLKADIAKMFRQFRLTKDDADMHRILWRETPDQPIREYRLTTVTYGTACAPNLSTRCLQQLALDVKDKYPKASNSLHNESYVDDVMSGDCTAPDAVTLYNELVAAVATAGMELRKFASNSSEVLLVIPEDHREVNPHSFDDGATVKALGCQWDPVSDNFKFNFIPPTDCTTLTKRILLSDLAKVFDPLGLIACITVRAKLLLQELWKAQTGWDDPVSELIQQQWISYQEDMKLIGNINIPRCLTPFRSVKHQLHGFCDASESAYAAVIYLRGQLPDGTVQSNLITSKTRVAPLRQVTLPRLELMGANLLAELISEVQGILPMQCELFLWTDSTITLQWISSPPRRWKTFVANRVAKIQECTSTDCWRHVPGSQNPADLASRGVPVLELSSSSFWLEGPEWLQQADLPTFPNPTVSSSSLEEKKIPAHVCSTTVTDFSIMEKFSTLLKLQRVTAHILRLFYNGKLINKHQKRDDHLTALELQTALMLWIKKVQRDHFTQDISSLESSHQVPPSSKLRTLHPYLDKNGFLRISGRLHHCAVPEDQKHQLILPANCHLTGLIVSHFHQKTLHGGFQLTWSAILSQYWIIGGRNKARFYIRSCVTCRRFRAESAQQLMGSLPAPRVTPSRPFTHTGVDYAGPFTLKNPIGRAPKTYKGYLCVFVCMATKAIHLEPVSSLTSEDFIATFRRFSSRRGFPFHMYSDRGTNFVGADKELQKLISSWNTSPHVRDHLSSLNITWHWNAPSCAHAGGLWEAGVKSAKHHLRSVVGNSFLTYEQFATILCQIEAILNSRPLYSFSSDPSDFTVLTPGHFLIGDPLIAVPDGNLLEVPSNRLNLYQQQQLRVQQFWRRWSKDYLNTLQQRNKWWWDKPNLQEGDLVLIMEDTPPATWKMARIEKVHKGEDGKVRTVTLRTSSNSSMERSIVKLIPLIRNDK